MNLGEHEMLQIVSDTLEEHEEVVVRSNQTFVAQLECYQAANCTSILGLVSELAESRDKINKINNLRQLIFM